MATFDQKRGVFDKKKMLVKSKLFDLESSFRAQNARHAIHIMMHELTNKFLSKFGGQGPVEF